MKRFLKILSAEHIGGYALKITFSDGKEKTVNFGPFLEQSQHPEIRKFLNRNKFKAFSIENGELMWGDYELIFPIMDLYNNRLDYGALTSKTKKAR